MSRTRRAVCSLIPALVMARSAFLVLADKRIPWHQLRLHTGTKAEHVHMRRILKVKMTTDEQIEGRETTLPPNAFPHPPHTHIHSEISLIRETTVELSIHGGTHRLGLGGLGLVRSNEEHDIKNLGLGPITRFVIAIATGAAV